MLALEAGKHVLCEKAFTVNAKQARKLIETAKAKKLFLMEAVWTRYFPLSIKIREMVTSGVIGKVHRVSADNSFAKADEDGNLTYDDSHRMVNKDLAGGALLDLGIYSLTWIYQILYHCQSKPRVAPRVVAAINKYEKTGSDEMTSIILQWEQFASMGLATTALRIATLPDGEGSPASGPAVRIQGTKGEIQIFGPIYRPTMYRVFILGGRKGEFEEVQCPIPTDPEKGGWGHGMFWEADEAARCLREGTLESDTLDWEESVVIMDAMDAVRNQGNLTYPEMIETAVFDKRSPLNVGQG